MACFKARHTTQYSMTKNNTDHYSLLDAPRIPLKANRSYWHLNNTSEIALALIQKAQKQPGLVVYLTQNAAQANSITELLAFFDPNEQLPIISFPEWETLPYDQFSPHQDIISTRLKTLYLLPQIRKGILVLPIESLVQKIAPHEFIQKYTFLLKPNDRLDIQQFISQLEVGGYQRVSQVSEHGEFAVRGALIDLFPMGSKTPFRLDLFDDEIDTIRSFDPETQRTLEQIDQIEFLPAKEYDLSAEGIQNFRQAFRTTFGETARKSQLYQSVSEGKTLDGLEYYLALFHPNIATLFDYLPADTLLFDHDQIEESVQKVWHDYQERYDIAQHNPDYPILAPSVLILDAETLFAKLKSFHRVSFQVIETKKTTAKFNLRTLPDLTYQPNSEYPLAKLNAFLDQNKQKVLFCAETTGRRETLLTLLGKHQHSPKQVQNWQDFLTQPAPLQIVVGPLEAPIYTEDFCLICEAQIFGETVIQKRRRKHKHAEFDSAISGIFELEIGNPVVHYDHGVGRYLGLENMTIQGQKHEFLMIEYAGGDKLYVPVTALQLVSRYTGANAETAPLHKLGTDKWEKAKKKAAEKVHDVAAELLDIYAQREARKGHQFITPKEAYASFAASFPFEETPDQQQAIEAVLHDMQQPKPMDRLICGDVGFGKTEVAMRAAFIAAFSGKQVALLVPTTLLSQQHTDNFKSRFADWPIRIEGLSRFQTAKEQKDILEALANHQVDIIIGTHKLIQNDIKFADLGLIIIDEEHRFGVRQKEQLKKLRTEIDVLTMTATPIPRTLNMAMNDLRALSIIATAPAKRLAVQTFVQQWNTDTVREACLREIRRGGQVFLLFNQVDKIESMAQTLRNLIPEAKVETAHGQMHERELEQVMQKFYHRRFDILVCTTIIETGIDIPTANTIIIHRADKFGLAQLHQLRGRVGRSHHKAYAYLFTPGKSLLTKDAEKRLTAIAKHDTLGAGFMLASHDLEIRGAGELLGDGQSGQIQEIGFTLYSELLERAVKSLKSGLQPNASLTQLQTTEVTLEEPTLIPEDYLPDIHTRLVFYKRIANTQDEAQIREIEVEMIDRFGLLPQQVKNLLTATKIKQWGEALNLKKIDAHSNMIRIHFGSQPKIDPIKLIQFIQLQPKKTQLKGQSELKYLDDMSNLEQRVNQIQFILHTLKPN